MYWLMVQAAGGSATIALGSGVIADISLPHERGKYLGVFQFAGTFSTASKYSAWILGEKRAAILTRQSDRYLEVCSHTHLAGDQYSGFSPSSVERY